MSRNFGFLLSTHLLTSSTELIEVTTVLVISLLSLYGVSSISIDKFDLVIGVSCCSDRPEDLICESAELITSYVVVG